MSWEGPSLSLSGNGKGTWPAFQNEGATFIIPFFPLAEIVSRFPGQGSVSQLLRLGQSPPSSLSVLWGIFTVSPARGAWEAAGLCWCPGDGRTHGLSGPQSRSGRRVAGGVGAG